jgi:ubiquitin-small subunit ribosomal protein S27Ae
MAKGGGAKKSDKGGKKEKVKKEGKKLSALYTISGDSVERKNKTCPKCGPGMFLASHNDRTVCGQCAYVEFNSKKEEGAPVEEDAKKDSKEIPAQ